jgi:predicted Zn-ribbon and HTH transcriptional regulator
MPIVTRLIKVEMLQCSHCGHEWERRREQLPKVCPRCKRRNWNEEKGDQK